ncbi:ATP synthase complex assembly protein atp12 [Kappamyces sp. JEL0829]|nr:ATP synthase complex assembly protein atp12 [Kappamyces sp. JEL0829]
MLRLRCVRFASGPKPSTAHSIASPSPAKLKKFWKAATVAQSPQGFSILLDGRQLKTPSGAPVRIPLSRKPLALLTAFEWEAQEATLKSYSLPLTSIVMRSIDSLANPTVREGVVDNLLSYVHTDSICYQQDYPDSFVKLQQQYWTPIIEWIKSKYGLDIKTTAGILRVKQSDKVMVAFRKIVEGYDDFTLAAFEKAVLRSKSFMIGLALVERQISVEFAADAARVEVMHQIDRWGEVEDSHDLDREDLRRQLGACVATLL